MQKCDNCFHKSICKHYESINNGDYAYMRVNFNPDECKDYFSFSSNKPPIPFPEIPKPQMIVETFGLKEIPYE